MEQERPYNRRCISVRVDRRVLRQHRIDDTGKNNNDTLQAHPGIRLQELTSDLGCAFACKRRKRDRSDSGVHEDLEDARVNGENHYKRQHRYEKRTDQRYDPQRNAVEEGALIDLLRDRIRQRDSGRQNASGMSGDVVENSVPDLEDAGQNVHAVADNRFCDCKADKQLQSDLWTLDLRKVGGRFHHTDNKEQNEQRIRDGFQPALDIGDCAPYGAAADVLRRGGQKRPDGLHGFRPKVECVVQNVYDPVTG